MTLTSSARTIAIAAIAASLAVGLVGCATERDSEPLVVVTTNILGDVVKNIVGNEAEVVVLMKPDADPHSFEISAQEAARILDADLIVSNGLGLEEGLQRHLDTAWAEGVPLISVGDVIEPIPYDPDESGGADDPHFWTDPGRMAVVVDAVTQRVIETVPGVDAAVIERNATVYAAELQALETDMDAAFAGIPRDSRQLVTNHHVFGYLADRFDFTIVGAVIPGGTTLAAPSASDLRDLVGAIEDAGVATIFAESSQPDRLVQVLADEAQLDVAVVELFTESLSAPGTGAETYLTMMRTNTERISTGLSP